jgi:hypothetical protein
MRRTFMFGLALFLNLVTASAHADVPTTRVQDLTLELPAGWNSIQQALDIGTGIFVFSAANATVSLFVRPGEYPDPQQFMVNGSNVVTPQSRTSFNGHAWTVMETRKNAASGSAIPAQSVFGFFGKYQGNAYFGYAKSDSSENARSAAIEFLTSLH